MAKWKITWRSSREDEEVEAYDVVRDGEWFVFRNIRGGVPEEVLRVREAEVSRIARAPEE